MTALKQNKKIKSTIMNLLDEGYDKTALYKRIQNDFGISQRDARIACKEVKIELLTKLKTLQSGMIEL
jgi:hypothetical protein